MADVEDLPAVDAEELRVVDAGVAVGRGTGTWCAVDLATGAVDVFDADGAPAAAPLRIDPTGLTATSIVAVDASADRVAVALADRVRIADREHGVVDVEHPSWGRFARGAVAFDPTPGSSRVWAAVPSEPVVGLAGQPRSGELWVVDADEGEVLARLPLDDDHPEGYELLPAGALGAVLGAGYGQDGSRTWCLAADGDVPGVHPCGWTGVAVGVDVVGSGAAEILCTPHDEEDAVVHAWPDGAAVITIEAGEEEEDGFDFAGAFLDADRLVIGTRSEELVVIARVDGTAIGRVRPGGDDPDVTVVWGVGAGRLLVQGRRTRLLGVR